MTLNYRTTTPPFWWATASSRSTSSSGIQGRPGRGQTGLQLDHTELLGRLNAASKPDH